MFATSSVARRPSARPEPPALFAPTGETRRTARSRISVRASLKQKILEVCDRKISEKGAGVGVSFYAFFSNRNDL